MKEVNFKPRERMLKGLDINCDAVIGTIGPKGRNVWIDDAMSPKFTNDGATISRSIVLKDPLEDSGNRIAKNTTAQTLDDAGDGTTTTACLLKAIVHAAIERPENPMMVRESLLKAVPKVVKAIKDASIKIKKEDIKKVALVSADDEVLATNISEIINKLGEEAEISVEDSYEGKTEHQIIDGYTAEVGFLSERFVTEKGKAKCVMANVPVFVSEKKISAIQDISPLWNYWQKKGVTSAVIVCEDIEPAVLGLLVVNKGMGTFNSVVIKATGDLLKDIEAVVGATRVSDETGVTFQMMAEADTYLGHVKKIECDASKSRFIPDTTKPALARAEHLEKFAAVEPNMYIKERLMKRISQLRGKIAILKICGQDFEREYLKDKADDAIKASKVALQEGVVEGGGMCLWRIAQAMKPKTVGEEILRKALIAPLKQNIENAGLDYAEVISNFPTPLIDMVDDKRHIYFGYDTRKNEYVDMVEDGIIDPAKVERVACQNAVASACQFITGSVSITELQEEKDGKN